MELFSVKRYAEEQGQKNNEDEILQNLLQKVAKRKRRSEKVPAPPPPASPGPPEEETAAKDEASAEVTSKKRKRSAEEEVKANELAATEPALGDVDDLIGGAAPDDVDDDEPSGFKVLGEDAAKAAKRSEAEMPLPPWLAHPTVIATDLSAGADDPAASLDALPYLQPHIRHALKEMHITRLFPVQSTIIPWLLEAHSKPQPFRARDICVSAPTGSGKTLAFAVPIVQLLAKRVTRRIQALVVLPVAELAVQVYKVFKKLCDKTDLTVCLLSKQFAFPLEQALLVEEYKGEYYSKVDIVVTTPGRLVDHLHATKGFCVKYLKFLVIDEADRIMDAVFQNWLYHLDDHVKATSDRLLSGRTAPLCYNELELLADSQPHKMLFSATLSQDPEKLQSLRLFQPKLFTSVLASAEELRSSFLQQGSADSSVARGEFIGKYTTPAELTEKYCLTESRLKPLTLYSLIVENEWSKFLCFTNSTDAAKRLTIVLRFLFKDSDFEVKDLSAANGPAQRAQVLSSLARGKLNGIICSDALARGIDIPDVDVVVSYDPARHVKTYIHRVGRTARAGRKGTAITLVNQKELDTFNGLLNEVGKELTDEIIVTTANEEENARRYADSLNWLRESLQRDLHAKKIAKVRAKGGAAKLQDKDPSQLTLMEKMQLKAESLVQKKLPQQPLDDDQEATKAGAAPPKLNKQQPKRGRKIFKKLQQK